MKKISVVRITGIFLLLLTGQLWAQTSHPTTPKSKIEPLPLAISYHKTTNLIFPYSIKSVDRGSKQVLVQKAKDVENILQIKAAIDSFRQTNLTVITSDGSVYSFLLNFESEPTTLNLELEDKVLFTQPVAQFISPDDNQAVLHTAAEQVSTKHPTVTGRKDKKFQVSMQVNGIYIKDNVLYFQIELENNSNINYHISQLRFYIRDKKKAKRTASQELEQTPLNILGNYSLIGGQSSQTIVVAMEKFTIPDKKQLIIQLMEDNGGRHLQLKLANKNIIRALILN